jgi:hypothetical protein
MDAVNRAQAKVVQECHKVEAASQCAFVKLQRDLDAQSNSSRFSIAFHHADDQPR